jgi:two-component system, NtrC family, response regulator GlrR
MRVPHSGTSTTLDTSDPVRGPVALVAPQRLRIVEGPDTNKVFAARSERFVVGTDERADVVLSDRTVSRFHCEIAIENDRVIVRDLGSRNGTLVDGVAIAVAYLRAGNVLQVGTTRLAFDFAHEPVAIPVTAEERFGSLVGRSIAIRAAFARLARAAANDVNVLLEGETGTGKEGAAESIHGASTRARGPFIVIDCGAIPPQLLESELFGHERGAFTGAVSTRRGAFEEASGGTIFLDEIGELPLELQPKLLRVLERRQIKHVGSAHYVPVDVRIIAATNRDLRAEVNANRFRSDLYYRLAVLDVRLPPLRERAGDLPLLVDHVLHSLGAATLPEAQPLRSPKFLEDLALHPWPGNVRELRNHIERCLALREPQAPERRLDEAVSATPGPLPPGATAAPTPSAEDLAAQPLRAARAAWDRDFERRYLEALLARHGDNVSAAARSAGIDRKYFYRLLWRNGLR